MLRRRHRTGPYALAQTRNPAFTVLSVLGAVASLGLVVWALRVVHGALNIGNTIERVAVILVPDERGVVSVAFAGEEPRLSDADLKLYPEDRVLTDRGSPATLSFFDGTDVRIDKGTAAFIEESAQGVKNSKLQLSLERGTAWIHTPTIASYSGAIRREVHTDRYTIEIPSDAEVLLSEEVVDVYRADGMGVRMLIKEIDEDIIVGEGQRYILTSEPVASDPYVHRMPITGTPAGFVLGNRARMMPGHMPQPPPPASETLLSVTSPAAGQMVRTATLQVAGTYGDGVDAVRVNGYMASLDVDRQTFVIEIAPPDASELLLTVEAIGSDGSVLAKVTRSVTRDRTPPAQPEIQSPAANGTTFRTSRETIEIRGTAPRGTVGIIVNDYRLQLFREGDATWSYLASTQLSNFAYGENVYRVVALNDAGYRSDPAVLTIVLGEGEEGVVSAGSSAARGGEPSPSSLANNAPLNPGSLVITAPTVGSSHTATLSATGLELLIEGTAPSGTASVWINNYQLRLYRPGKTFFNYIASTELNTLKRGENPYEIIVRNNEGKIIDRTVYTITVTRE